MRFSYYYRYALPCFAALLPFGCGEELQPGLFAETVDAPSYVEHIQPMMSAYCDRCHAEIFDGSSDFISTSYDDHDGITGVYGRRANIRRRVLLWEPTPMPPEGYLDLGTYDRLLLRRWLDTGAPFEREPLP